MSNLTPESCHGHILARLPKKLAYGSQNDFNTWKYQVRQKLVELLGDMPEQVPPNLRIEFEKDCGLFKEKRFIFTSEPYSDVPCHLLIPKNGTAPYPVVICLQGHSTGMHISLGRPKYKGDEGLINEGDRDFAIQAVKQGYAALVIEQRCFGERKSLPPIDQNCEFGTSCALLLGRTMIGERIWDVSRAIDALSLFPEADIGRIGCMGNSGGGTITYYASCLDERIKISMPSCSVCTFKDSIGMMQHCTDNYIPGILKYFDMGDIACLIAPRPLIVVAGRQDDIFLIDGVLESFETIKRIYAAAGAPDKCRLIIGGEGHRFYADQSWPVFRELAGW